MAGSLELSKNFVEGIMKSALLFLLLAALVGPIAKADSIGVLSCMSIKQKLFLEIEFFANDDLDGKDALTAASYDVLLAENYVDGGTAAPDQRDSNFNDVKLKITKSASIYEGPNFKLTVPANSKKSLLQVRTPAGNIITTTIKCETEL